MHEKPGKKTKVKKMRNGPRPTQKLLTYARAGDDTQPVFADFWPSPSVRVGSRGHVGIQSIVDVYFFGANHGAVPLSLHFHFRFFF